MIQIRELIETDIDEVFELEKQIFQSDAWSKQNLLSDSQASHTNYLVVQDNQQVVGYAGLSSPR